MINDRGRNPMVLSISAAEFELITDILHSMLGCSCTILRYPNRKMRSSLGLLTSRHEHDRVFSPVSMNHNIMFLVQGE